MNLRDGVISVRARLGENVAFKWSNENIIADLNESAKRMCSIAQNVNAYFEPALAANAQETWLPTIADTITAVGYYQGQLFQLAPVNENDVKWGGFSGSTPSYFYVRTDTRVLTPQVALGQISYTTIPNQIDPVTVIGTWPVTAEATVLNVWCTIFHPVMRNPIDPCSIPDRFKDAWTAFAIGRGKEKESAYQEADRFFQLHDKGTEEFRQYMMLQRQAVAPPSYGNMTPSFLNRPSSTVLIVGNNPGLTP